MRLTIERLRTLVLATGILLVVMLVAFLVFAHWKSRFNVREIPRRLGADIKQEANGVTYTQSRQGHTLFKIHASREVQLEKSGRVLLHDVQIELYGPDGKSLDRIRGGEFDYDQKAGLATAAGPVEITIVRPAASANMPLGKTAEDKAITSAYKNLARAHGPEQLDIRTSGLTFNQKTGIASTSRQLQFTSVQGSGSAVGATYDSQAGTLILSHDFQFTAQRSGQAMQLRAQSAAFDRDQMLCRMHGADASFRNGTATAGDAQILFRPDGSATRLDARSGFKLTTATGSKVSSPVGWLVFNQKNQPERGQMLDGVTMESTGNGRSTSGTAPTADLEFSAAGELRHARLQRGVDIHSEQAGTDGATLVRDWRSPVVDLDFRKAGSGGQIGLASLHGAGGVVIASHLQRANATQSPSRMSADTIVADFGKDQQLSHVIGTGHATLSQTTSNGAQQTTSGDRVDAQFARSSGHSTNSSAQIQSAVVDGHVVLTDQPVSKNGQTQPPLHATASHAVYDGRTQWLHLTGEPRIRDAGLDVAADRVDVSQTNGNAFAHGNVKGTWEGGSGTRGITLGGQGPAHVVASEAQVNRAGNEATFRGQARLWQQANSISAPVIVLNQQRQTLLAHSGGGHRVKLVMLTAAGTAKQEVVRILAGDLTYSEAERKAALRGNVVAQTGTATISSNETEIVLLPPGNHAGPQGAEAQVDTITAMGHVQIASQGRRGTGQRLVYTGETGAYELTGTAADPPTLTDPVRGTIRGQALIFNGRNDSVSIEGGGRKTTTETVAPR